MKKDRYECFYLAIFAPDMKRLRYILAVLLSLTVVYAVAGVSIVHYNQLTELPLSCPSYPDKTLNLP